MRVPVRDSSQLPLMLTKLSVVSTVVCVMVPDTAVHDCPEPPWANVLFPTLSVKVQLPAVATRSVVVPAVMVIGWGFPEYVPSLDAGVHWPSTSDSVPGVHVPMNALRSLPASVPPPLPESGRPP